MARGGMRISEALKLKVQEVDEVRLLSAHPEMADLPDI